MMNMMSSEKYVEFQHYMASGTDYIKSYRLNVTKCSSLECFWS